MRIDTWMGRAAAALTGLLIMATAAIAAQDRLQAAVQAAEHSPGFEHAQPTRKVTDWGTWLHLERNDGSAIVTIYQDKPINIMVRIHEPWKDSDTWLIRNLTKALAGEQITITAEDARQLRMGDGVQDWWPEKAHLSGTFLDDGKGGGWYQMRLSFK